VYDSALFWGGFQLSTQYISWFVTHRFLNIFTSPKIRKFPLKILFQCLLSTAQHLARSTPLSVFFFFSLKKKQTTTWLYIIILKAFPGRTTKQKNNIVHFSSSYLVFLSLCVCRRVPDRVVTGLIAPRLLRDGPISCRASSSVDAQKVEKKAKKPQGLTPPIKEKKEVESWLRATGFFISLQQLCSLSRHMY